jgi:hypothetical protein
MNATALRSVFATLARYLLFPFNPIHWAEIKTNFAIPSAPTNEDAKKSQSRENFLVSNLHFLILELTNLKSLRCDLPPPLMDPHRTKASSSYLCCVCIFTSRICPFLGIAAQ